MKRIALLVMVLLGVFVCIGYSQEADWQEISRGILGVNTVVFSADKREVIYLGADKGIFKSEDVGSTWANIFKVRGSEQGVNNLSFDANNNQGIYAATKAGLYYSANRGNSWKRVFRGKSVLEGYCTVVLSLPNAVYLGTKSGLFISKDRGRSWQKSAGRLGSGCVFSLVFSPRFAKYILVACENGVFKVSEVSGEDQRVYVGNSSIDDIAAGIDEDQNEEKIRRSRIRFLAFGPNSLDLYLATSSGLYISKDLGEAWEPMTDEGLLNKDVNFLLSGGFSAFYAATKEAVYSFDGYRWKELSSKLTGNQVNSLSMDRSNNLYACTDQGLFKSSINFDYSTSISKELFDEYCKDEPSISEVQQAAIEYAEVNPKKITQWRKWASRKAWLPQLSVGVDRNSTDLWHWEGGSTTKACDDELRRGKANIDWDVSLSWDLSELIWNNDQTSIDSRSKLMVELREDILDEINKTYFERIRLKVEIDNLQIEDKKKRFEKELRIKELTASLDGLTGGYFSRQIKMNLERK